MDIVLLKSDILEKRGEQKMDKTFIRERITELRMEKGVSEYQMSYDLGRNKNYIGTITSGRSMPSVSGLFDIMEYFEMTPVQFFEEGESPLIRKSMQYMRQLSQEDTRLLFGIIQLFYQRQANGSSDNCTPTPKTANDGL